MSKMQQAPIKFTSVQSAIVALRRGRKDPHWIEAARFLIERAAPDTQLLLDAQRALEQESQAIHQGHKPGAGQAIVKWLAIGCFAVAVIEALLLIWLSQSMC